MKHFDRSVRLVAAGAALAAASSCVWSQQASPYSLELFQTITYQPNIYQVADGEARTSDWISSTGVSFGVTQTLDAFSVFANGNVQANLYQDNHVLNNPGFGINLGASTTVDRLSSTIRYSASQSLGDYGTPGAAATTERNLQTNQEAALALRYRLTPRTSLVGGLGWQSLTYSADAFNSQESSSTGATLDMLHQLTSEFSAGLGLRYSNGSTPNYAIGATPGSYVADRFDGEYLDLLFSWNPAADTTLRGRVSYSRVTHSQATQLDYTGLTGGISWVYAPSERLALAATLTQNTGSGPSLLGSPLATAGVGTQAGGGGSTSGSGSGSGSASGPSTGGTSGGTSSSGGAPLTSNTNRLNTGLSFDATYQATRTISVNGNVALNYGDLADTSDNTGSALTTTLGLGINYVPTRSLSLGCTIGTTIQNADQSATTAGLAHSFGSPSIACTGTLIFF
jgi:hypothetical protein